MKEQLKREYLSHSALKAFLRSPNHYLQYVTRQIETTPAMLFGSAFHCYVLERDEFGKRYAVAPKVDKRTKEGKATWNAFSEAVTGREIITEDDMNTIVVMQEAMNNFEPARTILAACNSFEEERTDTLFGYAFKGIADAVGENFVVDVKTTLDASPEAFMKTAYNMGYHEQAAAYKLLFNVERFYWVAVEKNNPHNCAVYMQSERAGRLALTRLQNGIEAFKAWDGRGQSYSNETQILEMPSWA